MHTKNTTPRLASLLALTAALAGCGGASDKTATPAPPSPPPPPAAAPVSVSFVQSANNVLEPSSSEPLSVNVTTNGSTAPNGTVATFAVNPTTAGTLAPVAPTTVGGVASTTLTVSSLPPTATFQVTATATSSANSASDSLTYYVRPAHKPLQVLVPAYFTATGTTSPWTTLTSGATSYPDVQINAIASTSSGILTAATKEDTDLTTAIKAFRAVSGTSNRVIGYVATASSSGGTLSVADVKATIDNYIRLYPNLLDGFFLDGMAADSARVAYFQDIYNYVKVLASGMSTAASALGTPLLIGNPGTYPVPAYAAVADTLVTYAGNAAAYQNVDPQPSSTWVYAKANTAQAMLVHSASTCTEMQAAVKNANRPRLNTGMVYATNLAIGAPWSALPTYWPQLLGTVDALNKERTLPLC
ncbi:spherulation-specific family 4 protein [Acidovorax sp. D2M1]|uniref:Spherulation-specific family 4 protein n=1 Tax=Acidovorax benzenivorans TaxID=2987520 RepID=A0ABT5S082_9BURK|nr:spherulation-specific family 4 protein [Acidovorax benzenivorans]MDD2178836.1 spherulation-specific family 4 protein [Acidovorax benzenivorans]